MPLTPHKTSNYADDLREQIIGGEGFEGKVYYNSGDTPTVGYGLALYDKDSGSKVITAFSDIEKSGVKISKADHILFNKIESAMQASPRSDTKIKNLVDKLSLDLVNETTGKTVFSHTIGRYETANKIGDTLYSNLEDSKELIALTDIAYNGGSALLGPELRQALTDENRAEAWFQIRYNSNGGQSRINSGKGIAKRRVAESDTFGLYDETPSVEGMKDIISMARLHADAITTEESAFSVTHKSPSSNPYAEDNGITHQIQAAKDYLKHDNHHTDIQNDLPSNYYTPYIQKDDTQRDHVQIDLSQANPITLVQLMHALPTETLNQAQVSLKENDAIAISKKEELLIEKGDTFQDVQTHSQLSTAVLIAKNPWLVEKGRIHLPEETMVSTHVSNLSIKDQIYYENQENQKASNLTQEQQEDVQTYGLVKEGVAKDELTLANEAETSQAFSMDTVDYNKYLPEHVRQENNDATYGNEGGMDIA